MNTTRLLLVFTLSFLFLTAQAQEYQVFKEQFLEGIKKDNGETVVIASYDKIGWSSGDKKITGEVIGFQRNSFWGLMTVKGKEITNALYRSLENVGNDYFIASTIGKFSNRVLYGILNSKGKVVSSFRYSSFKKCYNDYLIVSEQVELKERFGVLSPKNGTVLPILYQSLSSIDNQQFLAKSFTGFYGVFDLKGKLIVPLIYDQISINKENQFVLEKDGLIGLADRKGSFLKKLTHKKIEKDHAELFSTWSIRDEENRVKESVLADSLNVLEVDRFLLFRNNKQVIYNGETDYTRKIEGFFIQDVLSDAIIVKNEEGIQVLDEKGHKLLPEAYDSIYYDHDYYYVKEQNRKSRWSLFSRIGTKLSDQVMDRIIPSSGKRIAFERDNYWGLLNFDGSLIAHPKYDTILPFRKKRALTKQLDLWGLIDDQSQWVILPYEDSLQCINDNLYVSQKGYHIKFYNQEGIHFKSITTAYDLLGEYILIEGESGKSGLIDYSWRAVTSIAYDQIEKVHGSGFFRVKINGALGIIDQYERSIVPIDSLLGNVIGVSEGKIGVQLDGKYGFLNISGQLVISNRYDSIQLFSEGLAPYQLNGKWGFLNDKEELVVQPYYEEVYSYSNGIAPVKYQGKWGFIDHKGEVLVDYQYKSLTIGKTGNYIVVDNNGKGLVDKKGRVLLIPQYQSLFDIEGERVIVKKNNLWGVLRHNGTYVIPTLYNAILYDKRSSQFLVREN